jgi:hypothetical protein
MIGEEKVIYFNDFDNDLFRTSNVQIAVLSGKGIERYRMVAGERDEWLCMECGRTFFLSDSERDSVTGLDHGTFRLCSRCLIRWELKHTHKGRKLVEFNLGRKILPAYDSAEFNNFDTTGAYSQSLAAARNAAIGWSQQVVQADCKTSFYLYSSSGSHGSGCGNGKTRLLWSSFKYVARRMPAIIGGVMLSPKVDFECCVINPHDLVSNFLSELGKGENGQKPKYRVSRPWKFIPTAVSTKE